MKKWRIHFFEKYGSETRSMLVEAEDEETAEEKAVEHADSHEGPKSLMVGDIEETDL